MGGLDTGDVAQGRGWRDDTDAGTSGMRMACNGTVAMSSEAGDPDPSGRWAGHGPR
jgi:hypothetical protein